MITPSVVNLHHCPSKCTLFHLKEIMRISANHELTSHLVYMQIRLTPSDDLFQRIVLAFYHQQNKFEDGTCGVCGDHYQTDQPEYVHPGQFATGVITRTLTEGQTFTAKVKITANHRGFFEFRVGKIGTPPMTNAKLTHLLELASGGTKWPLPDGKKEFSLDLKLPQGLVCDHCVMQWWWKDGNSWGCDDSGCGIGNGLQEVFVNCADIRILPKDGTLPPTDSPQTQLPVSQTPAPPTQAPVTSPPGGCQATGAWAGNTAMDQWCASNCAAGNCPASICVC